LYHARDATVQRARPAWTETLAGHRRFSKSATLLPLESLERSHRGLRATARRKTPPSGNPIPCGGSSCGRGKPVPLGDLLEKDRWKGEESPRVGLLLSDAGDSALKDKRPATSEELEEMLEDHQRLSEGVAERRGADVSGTTNFNDREGQGTTFPLRNQQKKFRPANAAEGERRNRAVCGFRPLDRRGWPPSGASPVSKH